MNLGTLYDIFLNFVFNKIFKIKNLSHPLMMVSAFGLYLGSTARNGKISQRYYFLQWMNYIFQLELIENGTSTDWIENLSSGLYLGSKAINGKISQINYSLQWATLFNFVKNGTNTDCSLDRKSVICSVFGSLLMVGLMEMSPMKWQ